MQYLCDSYWTDHGGCYHYSTGSKYTNYEDLLEAVKKEADDKSIPFRYIQVLNPYAYVIISVYFLIQRVGYRACSDFPTQVFFDSVYSVLATFLIISPEWHHVLHTSLVYDSLWSDC